MRGNLVFNELAFGKDDNSTRKKSKQDRRSGGDRRKLTNRDY